MAAETKQRESSFPFLEYNMVVSI